MRSLPVIALLAAVLMSGPAMAQRQIRVAEGEILPDLRPCIDYAGRGWLRMTGAYPDPDPDSIIDYPTYIYRFTQRQALFGASRRQPFEVYRRGHALRRVDVKDALVFVQDAPGGVRFPGWEWIWTDRAGRKFVPVFEWPTKERLGVDWKPLAFRRFAKRVSYADPQPYWRDIGWPDHRAIETEEYEEVPEQDRLFDGGANPRVRYGLYLSDLPALLKAANAEEDCWR